MVILNVKRSKQLRDFIESEVIQSKLEYFNQIRGGQESYTFLTAYQGRKYVVKVAVDDHVDLVPKGKSFNAHAMANAGRYACLQGIIAEKEFTWQGLSGIIMNNCGECIPILSYTKQNITEIIEAHKDLAQ